MTFASAVDCGEKPLADRRCVFDLKPAGEYQTELPALCSAFVSLTFLRGFRMDRRYGSRARIFVHCDERIVCLVALPAGASPWIFSPDVDLDFHRRIESAVYLTFQMDHLARQYGRLEFYGVDGGRDAQPIGMPLRRYGGGNIHQVKQPAAHHVAEAVRVVGKHDFCLNAPRLSHGLVITHRYRGVVRRILRSYERGSLVRGFPDAKA